MATKSDFTEEEWSKLQHGVAGTTLLVSVSDRGLFDTFKEAGAAARHLADARRDNSSKLIQELAASPAMGFGLGKRPEELESETLDSLRQSVSTLEAKAPDEVAAYKQFVLAVARSVAEAAKGVSASESDEIDKIESALGG